MRWGALVDPDPDENFAQERKDASDVIQAGNDCSLACWLGQDGGGRNTGFDGIMGLWSNVRSVGESGMSRDGWWTKNVWEGNGEVDGQCQFDTG